MIDWLSRDQDQDFFINTYNQSSHGSIHIFKYWKTRSFCFSSIKWKCYKKRERKFYSVNLLQNFDCFPKKELWSQQLIQIFIFLMKVLFLKSSRYMLPFSIAWREYTNFQVRGIFQLKLMNAKGTPVRIWPNCCLYIACNKFLL